VLSITIIKKHQIQKKPFGRGVLQPSSCSGSMYWPNTSNLLFFFLYRHLYLLLENSANQRAALLQHVSMLDDGCNSDQQNSPSICGGYERIHLTYELHHGNILLVEIVFKIYQPVGKLIEAYIINCCLLATFN